MRTTGDPAPTEPRRPARQDGSIRSPRPATVRANFRDITRDPREDEDWFQRLPAKVQEECREHWRRLEGRHDPWFERGRIMRNRTLLEATLLIVPPVALAALVLNVFLPILLAMVFSQATGYVWWHLRSGRLTSGLLGMVAAFLALALGGAGSGFAGFAMTTAATFLVGLLTAVAGLRRELDQREQAL